MFNIFILDLEILMGVGGDAEYNAIGWDVWIRSALAKSLGTQLCSVCGNMVTPFSFLFPDAT